MKKLAVIFPGIGYTCDKPLLYYSSKLAKKAGYEIRKAAYGGFPSGVRGNRKKMERAFKSALAQAEKLLSDINWSEYDRILFISKSVGTIVSGVYAKEHGLKVRSILYTPVTDTYSFVQADSIAFHGTSDPWAGTEDIVRLSAEHGIPLYLTENANHSLETGDTAADIKTLEHIMLISGEFIIG